MPAKEGRADLYYRKFSFSWRPDLPGLRNLVPEVSSRVTRIVLDPYLHFIELNRENNQLNVGVHEKRQK